MANAPGEQKSARWEDFLRYIAKDLWKEQPIWAITFLAFCAFMATVMWVHSGRVQGDPSWVQYLWFRLLLSVTVLVLPSLFYGFYAWWMRQK